MEQDSSVQFLYNENREVVAEKDYSRQYHPLYPWTGTDQLRQDTNICATQRDLYHKYREEGMNPQEAYRKMQ